VRVRDVPHDDPDAPRWSPRPGLSYGRSRGLATVVVTSIIWSVTLLAVSGSSHDNRANITGARAWVSAAAQGGAFLAERQPMEEWPQLLHCLLLRDPVEDLAGYTASALVLATFIMTSMRPLRIMAISSNVAFLYYAFLTNMRPILLLHGILLPINVFRLAQMECRRRRNRRPPRVPPNPNNQTSGNLPRQIPRQIQ
jgi:hypothetical protein